MVLSYLRTFFRNLFRQLSFQAIRAARANPVDTLRYE